MKTFIAVLTLAALAATSAVAQPPKVEAIRADAKNVYQSYGQDNQTFPDSDRDFEGQNARHIDF
jgi:hypothetical protein